MNKITQDVLNRIFPSLSHARWAEVNQNEIAEYALELMGVQPDHPNPFLDPEVVDKWMYFVHKLLKCDYSYGGFLEDRSTLWRGHYHKPGHLIHLGNDINVPEGTIVHMPTFGKLVHSFIDPDQEGGWGGKLIFETVNECPAYLLFGHLRGIPSDIGAMYEPGQPIGMIAGKELSGGWSPHLHLQQMREFIPDVDGYGAMYEGIEKDFVDPLLNL
jgi:hypothetical protein